jgi:hypothetical protein
MQQQRKHPCRARDGPVLWLVSVVGALKVETVGGDSTHMINFADGENYAGVRSRGTVPFYAARFFGVEPPAACSATIGRCGRILLQSPTGIADG